MIGRACRFAKLLTLVVVFFVTSVVSVGTGSTSLITVPVMIQLGIEPHIAVATNMFASIFLSAGGSNRGEVTSEPSGFPCIP